MAEHDQPAGVLQRLRSWARRIKRDGITLWFAARHPDTPLAAKLLGAFVVAYALSPIDLIPDFIPVLGLLDDVLLLPGLIWLTIRMLPPEVLASCRSKAEDFMASGEGKPSSTVGALFVVAIWFGAAWLAWQWWRALQAS
ncbi:MAG: DUF1232 domain-containing protein [Rubrivivax sp.]